LKVKGHSVKANYPSTSTNWENIPKYYWLAFVTGWSFRADSALYENAVHQKCSQLVDFVDIYLFQPESMYKSHVLWLRSGSPENLTLAPLNSPSC